MLLIKMLSYDELKITPNKKIELINKLIKL